MRLSLVRASPCFVQAVQTDCHHTSGQETTLSESSHHPPEMFNISPVRAASPGALFCGSGALLIGVGLLIGNSVAIALMQLTDGKSVSWSNDREAIDRNPGKLHAPYVFYTVEGVDYATEMQVQYEGSARIDTKQPVQVYYSSDDPEAGRVAIFLGFWFPTIVTNSTGIVMIIISRQLAIAARNEVPE